MKQLKIKLTEEQRNQIEDTIVNYMHGIKMYRVACSYDRGYQEGVQRAEDYMITALDNIKEENQ